MKAGLCLRRGMAGILAAAPFAAMAARSLSASLVCIISAVSQQDRTRLETVEPVKCAMPVIGLAGAQAECDRKAIGIDHRMYPGCQCAVRTAHATGSAIFFGITAMLVHPDGRTVDHLDIAIISLGYSVQQSCPMPCLAPAVEPVHAGCMRAMTRGNVRPRRAVRSRQNIPFKTRRSSTRSTPRGLFGNKGSITDHSKSDKSKPAIIQSPSMEY